MARSIAGTLESRYLGALQEALSEVSAKFRQEPASFLYESDLQGLLFTKLFDRLADVPLRWKPDSKRWSIIKGDQALLINPVKTEYPTGRRFDIALIEPELPVVDPVWDLDVRAAVEIKFWQADGTGGGYDRDFQKLSAYAEEAKKTGRRFTGVCAVFCHRSDESFLSEWFTDRNPINPTNVAIPRHGVLFVVFTP